MMRFAAKCLVLAFLAAAFAWNVSALASAQLDDNGDSAATTDTSPATKSKSSEKSASGESGEQPRADDGDQTDGADEADETDEDDDAEDAEATSSRRQGLMAGLTIFVLAVFVGFEVITKVPPTLHTPLMSGSNAISGITLVGAVIVAGSGLFFSAFIGLWAVALGTVNVVGGFLVTHRMLAMFGKKKQRSGK